MASKINFGVGVSNAFDLLEDETEDNQNQTQKGKDTRKTVQPKGKVAVDSKKETASPKEGGRFQDQKGAPKSEGQPQKKGRKEHIVGEYSGQKQQAAAAPAPAENEEREEREEKGFQKVESSASRNNDQRRGSARGRGEGSGQRFKRQYDRRSGTGRGKEVSKGGSGKANWGRGEESFEEPQAPGASEEAPAPEPVVEKELTPEEKIDKEKREKEAEERRLQEEKENNYKLLDEYLEEKKKKAPVIPLPAPRNPNEDTPQSQWKEFVPLKKNAPESSVPRSKEQKKDEKKEVTKESPKEVKKKEKIADELLGFQSAPRPVPERENRREGGGGGGRGERRGQGRGNRPPRKTNQGRGTEKAINLDATQFPSLATKA